jgi:hypothetical protein
MKTAKNTGLGVILVLLVCFTVICGCKKEKAKVKYGTFPGLDAKTEKRITRDLFNHSVEKFRKLGAEDVELKKLTVEDFRFPCYYGTYNGYVVIMQRVSSIELGIWIVDIDGIVLSGGAGPGLVAWKDGVFHDIKDLYEQGLLTREDILMIQTMQKQGKGGRL